jgi:hypothetical protein
MPELSGDQRKVLAALVEPAVPAAERTRQPCLGSPVMKVKVAGHFAARV